MFAKSSLKRHAAQTKFVMGWEGPNAPRNAAVPICTAYASAASLFVELPWVPLKLLFRLLLKELENSQKIADFRVSTKFDSGRKIKIWHGSPLRNDLKCLSFLCGVGGTRSSGTSIAADRKDR